VKSFLPLKKWYTKVKKKFFNKHIKHIRTDNGTEFYNFNFDNFCDLNGIVHQTISYNLFNKMEEPKGYKRNSYNATIILKG